MPKVCIECKELLDLTVRNKGAHLRTVYCSKECKAIARRRKEYYHEQRLDYRWRLRQLCAMAKNRAKAKGIEHNIDRDYLIYLWEENQGCCALTGTPFDLANWGDKGQVNPHAPSVDRVNPKLGYTKDNVRLITYHMNISLSDFGVEQFEFLVKNYLSNI